VAVVFSMGWFSLGVAGWNFPIASVWALDR
jgi:hypothetical protein